jgi:glutamate/tyrosine decarboxylase-like PLP-dependent enzyme
LKEVLGLPGTASVGFVTGGQGANTVGLAAARHRVLADAGWDVEQDGLGGAPAIRVLATGERHATIDRALRLLGLGTGALRSVPTDEQGRSTSLRSPAHWTTVHRDRSSSACRRAT